MRLTSVLFLAAGCSSTNIGQATQEIADPAPVLSIVSGDFNNPAGGSRISFCDPSTTACSSAPSIQVRWGTPASGSTQSGLGFEPAASTTITYGATFAIGTLSHFNMPTYQGTAASAVDLTLELKVDPSVPGPSLFDAPITIPFTIDETPNVEPCPYPSDPGNPCSDKISFGTSTFSLTSTSSETVYDLQIAGFVDPTSSAPVDGLISQENGTSSAELLAVLTEHCVDANNNGICDDHEVDYLCPCDSDWKNHGQYVSCVAHVTTQAVGAGEMTAQQRAIIVSTAGQSNCGK
jgi:hypothetical protein